MQQIVYRDDLGCSSLCSDSSIFVYFSLLKEKLFSMNVFLLAGMLQQLCSILMASGVPADVLTEVSTQVFLFS